MTFFNIIFNVGVFCYDRLFNNIFNFYDYLFDILLLTQFFFRQFSKEHMLLNNTGRCSREIHKTMRTRKIFEIIIYAIIECFLQEKNELFSP